MKIKARLIKATEKAFLFDPFYEGRDDLFLAGEETWLPRSQVSLYRKNMTPINKGDKVTKNETIIVELPDWMTDKVRAFTKLPSD